MSVFYRATSIVEQYLLVYWSGKILYIDARSKFRPFSTSKPPNPICIDNLPTSSNSLSHSISTNR